MTDERFRWVLEQLAKDGNVMAKWALGHTDIPEQTIQRLNKRYADIFTLRIRD